MSITRLLQCAIFVELAPKRQKAGSLLPSPGVSRLSSRTQARADIPLTCIAGQKQAAKARLDCAQRHTGSPRSHKELDPSPKSMQLFSQTSRTVPIFMPNIPSSCTKLPPSPVPKHHENACLLIQIRCYASSIVTRVSGSCRPAAIYQCFSDVAVHDIL